MSFWYCVQIIFSNKFPKYSGSHKTNCCNFSQICTMWFYHKVMCPKGAVPDQTAPSIRRGKLFGQTSLSKKPRIITVILPMHTQYRWNECSLDLLILLITDKLFDKFVYNVYFARCCYVLFIPWWSIQVVKNVDIKLLNEPGHEETCLCHMRTTKAQISLRNFAVWSVLLLFAAWIVLYLFLLYPKFQASR